MIRLSTQSSVSASPLVPRLSREHRNVSDRIGDPILRALALLAALAAVVAVALIVYEVFSQSGEAFSHFGLGFVTGRQWNPVANQYGAAEFLFGTVITAFGALLVAGPISIAIALFLTELAPRRARRPVATLVELLAAVPSVVLGLWGLIVLAPVMNSTIEPALSSVLGWIPLFSGSPSPVGLLPAIVILTIMTVPIVSAITREVFETVPTELKEGALALGATRWEMVRMVMLPYGRTGMVGGTLLGLGRALGEAIAVTMVIGHTPYIGASLFHTGDTAASRIASEYLGASTSLNISALVYLGAILLVLALIANVVARLIVGRSGGRQPLVRGIWR